ncbi:hypothetical protein [Sphingomonas flavalba]|uniref:hypothetical protein n=1 Tax=Sphingomonas flavalba TaxID=2559804 RepID=UPI00109DE43F|nr:hypothetical protein [Sphingomonas flavalba]
MTGPTQVGFLFNHEAPHQVAHSLPIALALSRLRPDIAVHIFHAGGAVADEVRRLAGATPHRCTVTELSVRSRAARLAARLAGDNAPFARIALLRDNVDRFAGLAALVVPEKTSLLLKTRFGLPNLRIVHTRHGAGDRAIGFDKASGGFDFVLVSGPKIRDRLLAAGLVRPGGYAIVGYPKFDLLADRPPPPDPFGNGRPTVVYNPHPSPHLSSWYRMGQAILAYFRRSTDFNLIFAPHVMLFRKRLAVSIDRLAVARVGRVAADHYRADNMLIDLGSRASVDMTHMRAADIYLGDASSQVYEFLWKPRPCVFVDAHRTAWRGNPDFDHMRAGPVVADIPALDRALRQAQADHARYAPVQRAMFANSFALTDQPSALRAAHALSEWLGGAGSGGWTSPSA